MHRNTLTVSGLQERLCCRLYIVPAHRPAHLMRAGDWLQSGGALRFKSLAASSPTLHDWVSNGGEAPGVPSCPSQLRGTSESCAASHRRCVCLRVEADWSRCRSETVDAWWHRSC